MSHIDEVADGRPVRHLSYTQWVGVAVVGILASLSVFASGYLVGSGRDDPPPTPTPAAAESPSAPVLPARREKPAEPKTPDAPNTRRVTVESGQSLWQIAATYAPGRDPLVTLLPILAAGL